MRVIVNPGTEPIEGASVELAEAAMHQFFVDVGLSEESGESDFTRAYDRETLAYRDQGRGWFGFLLRHCPESGEHRSVEIQMPGLPLSQIRFMGEDGQNIFAFRRVYVDGSSFHWKWAINVARDDLFGEERAP